MHEEGKSSHGTPWPGRSGPEISRRSPSPTSACSTRRPCRCSTAFSCMANSAPGGIPHIQHTLRRRPGRPPGRSGGRGTPGARTRPGEPGTPRPTQTGNRRWRPQPGRTHTPGGRRQRNSGTGPGRWIQTPEGHEQNASGGDRAMTAEITGGEATPEGKKHAHVIYHAGCADGFGAAWAADTALRKEPGRTMTYTPAAYGDSPPDVRRGSDVYILDFSYPLEQMRALAEGAGGLTLHRPPRHRPRRPGGEDAQDATSTPEHSGAYLTWRRFHPDEPVPELHPLRRGPGPVEVGDAGLKGGVGRHRLPAVRFRRLGPAGHGARSHWRAQPFSDTRKSRWGESQAARTWSASQATGSRPHAPRCWPRRSARSCSGGSRTPRSARCTAARTPGADGPRESGACAAPDQGVQNQGVQTWPSWRRPSKPAAVQNQAAGFKQPGGRDAGPS